MKGLGTVQVCRLLKVSKSGLYASRKRREREKTDAEQKIINCFDENDGNYGRIRIKESLEKAEERIIVSEKKIARVLKKYGRVAKAGRRSKGKRAKKSEPEYISENLLLGRKPAEKPNEVWQSDITEFRVRNGKLYLCGILDSAKRKIVGWCVLSNARKEIVERALHMAIGRAEPGDGLIFHSDRGSVYTCIRIKEMLEQNKMISSMSRPGTPNDNQLVETLWKTMKLELDSLTHLTFKEAKRKIACYIEMYYNSKRLHSSLGYQTPNEAWAQAMRAG